MKKTNITSNGINANILIHFSRFVEWKNDERTLTSQIELCRQISLICFKFSNIPSCNADENVQLQELLWR